MFHRIGLVWALLFLPVLTVAQQKSDKPPSAEEQPFPCFTVHGRYAVYIADGQEEIWVIGTHRLLRPVKGSDPLQQKLLGIENEKALYGDFTVCPLEKDTPGAMRNVRIETWKNLRFGPPSRRQSGND